VNSKRLIRLSQGVHVHLGEETANEGRPQILKTTKRVSKMLKEDLDHFLGMDQENMHPSIYLHTKAQEEERVVVLKDSRSEGDKRHAKLAVNWSNYVQDFIRCIAMPMCLPHRSLC
jgi:GTP cyclohydrolase I